MKTTRFKPFGFTLPNLPKPVYNWLKDCRDRHQVSWFVIIVAAAKALEELEQRDPVEINRVLTWAKKF